MKKILIFTVFLLLTLSVKVNAQDISIVIDNNPVTFTESSGAPFADENSRTQVPLRVTMETYGANVDWEQSTQTAIVTKDGITVKVPMNKNYIYVNDKQTAIDTQSVVVNNRIYLPIRFVIEALGGNVDWNNETKTVVIKKEVVNTSVKKTYTLVNDTDTSYDACIIEDKVNFFDKLPANSCYYGSSQRYRKMREQYEIYGDYKIVATLNDGDKFKIINETDYFAEIEINGIHGYIVKGVNGTYGVYGNTYYDIYRKNIVNVTLSDDSYQMIQNGTYNCEIEIEDEKLIIKSLDGFVYGDEYCVIIPGYTKRNYGEDSHLVFKNFMNNKTCVQFNYDTILKIKKIEVGIDPQDWLCWQDYDFYTWGRIPPRILNDGLYKIEETHYAPSYLKLSSLKKVDEFYQINILLKKNGKVVDKIEIWNNKTGDIVHGYHVKEESEYNLPAFRTDKYFDEIDFECVKMEE